MANRRRLFKHRLGRMAIGDALVCNTGTRWRVDCLVDTMSDVVYSITNGHGDSIRRKRLESAVDYLMSSKAPDSLEFVQEGAYHLLKDNTSVDELLGYYPAVDLKAELQPEHRFRGIQMLYHPLRNLFYMAIAPAHQIVRFVLQEGQIDWFDKSTLKPQKGY